MQLGIQFGSRTQQYSRLFDDCLQMYSKFVVNASREEGIALCGGADEGRMGSGMQHDSSVNSSRSRVTERAAWRRANVTSLPHQPRRPPTRQQRVGGGVGLQRQIRRRQAGHAIACFPPPFRTLMWHCTLCIIPAELTHTGGAWLAPPHARAWDTGGGRERGVSVQGSCVQGFKKADLCALVSEVKEGAVGDWGHVSCGGVAVSGVRSKGRRRAAAQAVALANNCRGYRHRASRQWGGAGSRASCQCGVLTNR